VDPVVFLNDIIHENLDRLIAARLEQDLEMVEGQDAELAAALRRVIRFLQPDAVVLPVPYASHTAGEPS
jgi:LmbE family N-acetylglucosaminyl deacetylase